MDVVDLPPRARVRLSLQRPPAVAEINIMLGYQTLDVYQCAIRLLALCARLSSEVPKGQGALGDPRPAFSSCLFLAPLLTIDTSATMYGSTNVAVTLTALEVNLLFT